MDGLGGARGRCGVGTRLAVLAVLAVLAREVDREELRTLRGGGGGVLRVRCVLHVTVVDALRHTVGVAGGGGMLGVVVDVECP